tara:strand:+ start:332 stop:1399 length:1068 start_codon:yes stop_codon:yes gene_type:complete
MKNFFKNKKILITGHTGFKGSWLTLWFIHMGAKIMGVSAGYPTTPSNFKILKLEKKIDHKIADIRDHKKIKKLVLKFKPDYLFHLAAEAIVKKSYQNPKKAWETNTLGTVNLMEALKDYKKNIVVVIITSDKVYKNIEILRGYKENDTLGSFDPYSASKASADLAVQSYTQSFFKKKKNIRIAIARAGNVIGGGDWSSGRLIPDCVRQWSNNKTVVLRNPKSTRPWQHVLDILRGYILLAINLKKNKSYSGEAFNFGPKKTKNIKDFQVLSVVKEMNLHWNKAKWKIKKNKTFFESNLLQLDSTKANKKLRWKCLLSLKKSIFFTTTWYKIYHKKSQNIFNFSINQIKNYENFFL